MKHLLTTLFAVCLSFTAAVAQDKTTDKAPQEKTMSKEDKAAAKAKKEADLQEAFKTAGVTADEQGKFKVIVDESSALNKTIKADSSLTADEKMTKAKENTKARDAKLKELLGEAKYKALKDIQKAQKEAQVK
ncbi:MAG: hypothetical protein H7Y10_01285 [Flavobacterium sp.]|nr:hypothetical protein [Flavobacterium sp.]